MKLHAIICSLLVLTASLYAAVPGQPWAGLWHLKDTDPAYLLNHNITTDPDAPYMRSGTALANRGRNAAFKVNANARSRYARNAACTHRARFSLLLIHYLHAQAASVDHEINMLMPIKGTPMQDNEQSDTFTMIRMIATARIAMLRAKVRLSAGRTAMSKEALTLCFFAGANSIFYGDKLLTAANPRANEDLALLRELGMSPQEPYADVEAPASACATACCP